MVGAALADAQAYAEGGVDAIVIENFGDVPFTAKSVAPETVAGMARAAVAIAGACPDLDFGFNVLRNDARSALGLAASCGGQFVRVNVHSGAMVTDQGVIQGNAFETIRAREALAPGVAILADVHVKHAAPLGEMSIEDAAKDTAQRGLADALIVSGTGTGAAIDLEDARRIKAACPEVPLFVGSGATLDNASALSAIVDGIIVGSSLKKDGLLANAVDRARVEAFVAAAKQ